MDLLNLQFAILVVKIALCAITAFFGIAFILTGEDNKRTWRDIVCRALFGFSNAIPYKKFARFLLTCGLLLLAFSGLCSWFLFLR